MIIPHAEIDNETLENIIESVVLRDGTDYGDVEMSLSEKVALVKKQLKQGIAAIEYSEEHESVNIISIE
jgi:hypothetical protein